MHKNTKYKFIINITPSNWHLRPKYHKCQCYVFNSWCKLSLWKFGRIIWTQNPICSLQNTYYDKKYFIISPNEVFGDIMVLASPPPPRPPRWCEHSNSKSIKRISFKFNMRVDTPMRFVAIEIWYPPRTRTTAFAAKRHSYPPNLQNAISP